MVSEKFNDDQCYEAVRQYAEKNLKKSRYEHSLRVSETAAYMCRLYGLDEKLGLIAGIGHDICKEISDEQMIELALKDGGKISPEEKQNVFLLHGRAAAVKVQSEFAISDKDVIEAIANHTLGMKNCCNLAKIIFVADKIEPGRPQSTEEYRKNLFDKSLDELTVAVLQENIEYLEAHGKSPAAESLEWLNQLKHDIK